MSSATKKLYQILIKAFSVLGYVLGLVRDIGDCGFETADQQLKALGLMNGPNASSRSACSAYYENEDTDEESPP